MPAPIRLRFTNTYSKALEPFSPLAPDAHTVTMYSCGPTVYSFAHIGNFRSFLLGDILRRVLERAGHRVHQVMNITDVGHMTQDHLADAGGEDKLSKAARELGWDPYTVAQHFLAAFEADARALRLRIYAAPDGDDPARHPRATRFIPEMLALIQRLLERGHAYTDSAGQVYFSIASFPEYGRLSGKVIDELEVGARVEVREEKRDPRDFALWKVDAKHLMQWDPHGPDGWTGDDRARLGRLLPGGVDPAVKKGFPGWHIECSAMVRACLGEVIDVHTGGEDNIFPHHECEIAQTCAACDTVVPGPEGDPAPRRTFARFWIHGRHLLVEGRKMSKRDGTFFTVRDLFDPGAAGRPDLAERLVAAGFAEGRVAPAVLRLTLLWGHYRQPMNFSFDHLTQARNAVVRLQSLYDRAFEAAPASATGAASPATSEAIATGLAAFDAALADDLDIERAMAVTLDLVSRLNQVDLAAAPADAAAVKAALESVDQVLDVLTRRRIGVLDRDRLGRWADPAFLRDTGARLQAAGWAAGGADRAAVVDALSAGALPAAPVLMAVAGDIDDDLVELLIAARQAARKARDFSAADALREHLRGRGVIIEDLPHGIRWKTG
jgi:cysteinyl-tRNA synthetase